MREVNARAAAARRGCAAYDADDELQRAACAPMRSRRCSLRTNLGSAGGPLASESSASARRLPPRSRLTCRDGLRPAANASACLERRGDIALRDMEAVVILRPDNRPRKVLGSAGTLDPPPEGPHRAKAWPPRLSSGAQWGETVASKSRPGRTSPCWLLVGRTSYRTAAPRLCFVSLPSRASRLSRELMLAAVVSVSSASAAGF